MGKQMSQPNRYPLRCISFQSGMTACQPTAIRFWSLAEAKPHLSLTAVRLFMDVVAAVNYRKQP